LEGTGLGHFPTEAFDADTRENLEIFNEIKALAKDKVVCMTTQTGHGRINMNVYSPGRLLKEAGVLGHNLDMTVETAYIKLAWLLSNYDVDDAKRLYSENLRGEISERSENEEF
jgi:glutamyl-tRNA(Gln) amidotransferase subunit D